MRAIRCAVLSMGFFGAFALPRAAQAEEGEFQLGVLTPVLTYTKLTEELEVGGVDSETDVSGFTWGVGHAILGEVGYGITPNLLLGGLFQLAGVSGSQENEAGDEVETSDFDVFLGPKLDYVFLPGDKVQPFLGVALALAHTSSSSELAGAELETSATGYQLVLRGGVRAFPVNEFSIDPALMLSYASLSGDTEAFGGEADFTMSGYTIGIVLGISGWLD